ncbi:hypothetical protein FB451DRAFT_1180736 [Mycena latifolia]|nr:hypothetical protein FB451DRAFT_1180736 [Mycena latifolia]
MAARLCTVSTCTLTCLELHIDNQGGAPGLTPGSLGAQTRTRPALEFDTLGTRISTAIAFKCAEKININKGPAPGTERILLSPESPISWTCKGYTIVALWESDLDRYDVFGQDKFSERRGIVYTDFKPWYQYRLVDFMKYGWRPLVNWKAIRPCAERFKCTVQNTHQDVVCTFFRQSPLRADEPAHFRVQPVRHQWELSQFASGEYGEETDETEWFFDDIILVREQVKNRWAPRPGRTFNTYNRGLDAPVRVRNEWEDTPVESRPLIERIRRYVPREGSVGVSDGATWRSTDHRPTLKERKGLASTRYSTSSPVSEQQENTEVYYQHPPSENRRRRASSSPLRRFTRARPWRRLGGSDIYEDVPEEIEQSHSPAIPTQGEEPVVLIDSSPDPTDEYIPNFQLEDDAVAALVEFWNRIMVNNNPARRMRANLNWNRTWTDMAILVCKDPRSHLRLKMIANCHEDMDSIIDVLNLAWRWGIPFQLFMPQDKARTFRSFNLDDVDNFILLAMLGYQERFLTYGNGGVAAYGRSLSSVRELPQCHNAVAFISEGGIVSELAQVIDPNLIYRFVQGPSLQVSEYSKGETFLRRDPPDGVEPGLYTTDRVSAEEILLLLGHIPTGHPSTDLTLFPSPATFEEYSNHCRGMITHGSFKILVNLLQDLDRKKYVWRTQAQWNGS